MTSRLLPREPTQEMLAAGTAVVTHSHGIMDSYGWMQKYWKAMYDAAPNNEKRENFGSVIGMGTNAQRKASLKQEAERSKVANPASSPEDEEAKWKAHDDATRPSTSDLVARLREFPLFWLNGAAWMQSTQKEPLCLQAAAELERMAAKIVKLETIGREYASLLGQLFVANKERDAALARAEAAEKDAARYRWIQEQGGYVTHADPLRSNIAIDAVIAADGK